MIEIVEATKAMNTLRRYCAEQNEKCKGCIFDKGRFCYLMKGADDPSGWTDSELNKSNILEDRLKKKFKEDIVEATMMEVRMIYDQ